MCHFSIKIMCPSKADRVNCLIRSDYDYCTELKISIEHFVVSCISMFTLGEEFFLSISKPDRGYWRKTSLYWFSVLLMDIWFWRQDFFLLYTSFQIHYFITLLYETQLVYLYIARMGEVSPDGLGTFILKGYLGNAHIDGLFFIKGLPLALMRKISLSFSKNSKIVWHFPKFPPEQCFCYYF